MNIVHLMGRIGQEPELRTMQNGKVMASFSLATSKRWKDSNGDKQEKTTWHRCVCFQEWLAKVIDKNVAKGDLLQVSGSIESRSYEKDGEKRTAFEIVVSDINFVPTSKSDSQPRGDNPPAQQRPVMDNASSFARDEPDSVPF